MSSTVTTSGTIDGTLSLMALAASSDSKTTIPRPESSFRVQYPATNPGACDTPGTTCSRRWLSATSRSLIETVTTTACMTPLLGSSNSSRPYPTGGNPKTPGRSVVGRGADPLGDLPERPGRATRLTADPARHGSGGSLRAVGGDRRQLEDLVELFVGWRLRAYLGGESAYPFLGGHLSHAPSGLGGGRILPLG